MEPLGQHLRTQRELRDVMLMQVADETKISYNWLEAIEKDQWETLPAHVYTRGFVKSYAKTLGLDVQDILLRFDEMVKGSAEEEEISQVVKPRGPIHLVWYSIVAIAIAILVLAVIFL